MSAALKFTLGRIGLFVAVFLVLLPFPQLSLLIKLLVAVVTSFALSWFLLRGWRDQMAVEMDQKVKRRREEKAELRAALAGEDDPTTGDASHDASADDASDASAGDATEPDRRRDGAG